MKHAPGFTVEPNWKPLLKDLGVVPANVLRRADLPQDLLQRSNIILSPEQYFAFWRGMEAEIADPLLPLKLGKAITTESFSPPIFAAMCSPNYRIALQRLQHYKRLIAPVRLILHTTPRSFTIEVEWPVIPLEIPSSLIVAELVFFIVLARIGTREHIQPLRVSVPIPPKTAAPYTEFLEPLYKAVQRLL